MYKILNSIKDKKIDTDNLYIETTYGDYLEVANQIIHNNEYQRKRVRASSTIYSQLKEDMKVGCIFPPIVLALTKEDREEKFDFEKDNDKIRKLMPKALILDGLQRTYTMLDAYSELDESEKETFSAQPLRIELYIDINRFGILYRMLTLNTGQTPMSLRHQIEILYGNLDLTDKEITLIKELEGKSPKNLGEYQFKDMIEGFVSYLNNSYLPMTRNSVLETIKSLEAMTNEDVSQDLFEIFVSLYNNTMKKMNNILSDEMLQEYNEDMTEEVDEGFKNSSSETPTAYLFAKDIRTLSIKSQVITGFGAALSFLKEKQDIQSIFDISQKIDKLVPGGDNDYQWYSLMNQHLDSIKSTSKKIGNSQRLYFYYFFRNLFLEGSDSYLNLTESTKKAKERYDLDY